MKRLSLRLRIALATFFVGVAIVALWFFNRSNSVPDAAPKTSDCYPIFVDNFDASDYKGVLTGRVFTINASKNTKSVSDEEVNGEVTANLFKRFREMPLTSQGVCVDESYRLTWIPTFHAPTVIRAWRSDDKYFVVTKRLNGKGGYGLGDLETEQTHSLSAEEWQSFGSLINQASFWKIPSAIEEPMPQDGATWTFEGFSNGKFHSVLRVMPSKELTQIFRNLFVLSGVETEQKLYLP